MSKLIAPDLAATAALAVPALGALPAPALAQNSDASARSSSMAPIPARARPTTRSWSAPASPRASASAFPSASPERLAARPARPGPTAPRAFETVGRDRHQQLLAGRPGRLHRLHRAADQPGPRREREETSSEGHGARRSRAWPTSAAFSAAIQALICASSASSGTAPWPEHRVMEAAQVELGAQLLLRPRPQLADLELAQLVGQRLAGVGDVAVDLGVDIGVGQGRIVLHEGDRLLLGPALGVDARCRPPAASRATFHSLAGPCPSAACRRAPARSRAAPNRGPSPRRRR